MDELTLGQSFECNECGNALHDKAIFITRKCAYTKEKSFHVFGGNLCTESTLVAPSSHCEFHEDKCHKIGDSLRKVAQVQRTNTREKTFGQKAQFTEYQRNHTEVQPLECRKNFNYNSAINVQQRTHTLELSCDNKTREETFSSQSAFRIQQRTQVTEKCYECHEYQKYFCRRSSFILHQRSHTGKKNL